MRNPPHTTGGGTVFLEPKLSLLALVIAAAIALITVLISAAIPAGRATKISPIDAIRQKNDYNVPKKSIRVRKAVYKLFGLPGFLSRKYYKVSKKKYRATVISLVISIILFISAASVSQMIRSAADRAIDTENFDMLCMGDRTELEEIRQQEFVAEAVYSADTDYLASVPDDMLSGSFLDCWSAIKDEYEMLDKNMHDICLVYLEDTAFKNYLAAHNIPEAPYFSEKTPTALVVAKEVTVYHFDNEGGAAERFTYAYEPYDAEGDTLYMLRDGVPAVLNPFGADGPGAYSYQYYTTEDGDTVLAVVPYIDMGNNMIQEDWDNRVEYLLRLQTSGDGITTVHYYGRDPVTGAISEAPQATETMNTPSIRIGATVTELPFGITNSAVDSYYYNYLILPMSALPENSDVAVELCITVSDYAAAKTYLDATLGEDRYWDYKASEENNRTLVLLINVFSYGFIILISLISVANVFNTISTNVSLRRRDFGMLRSVGFREKDLLKMMNYECLTYGGKALIWGIPISLVLSFLIQNINRGISSVEFTPPWSALMIAVVCVFLVVFTTMFYAVSKLRKDNPIEAIRIETT